MSPLAATLHFGCVYADACKAYVRRNLDRDTSERVKPANLVVPLKADATLTKLWKARQFADSLSVPYEMYMHFCFEFGEARKRHFAPRPEQLKPSEKSKTAWHAEFVKFWEEEIDHWVNEAKLPDQFRIEAYHRLPAQIALHKFIVERVNAAHSPWHQVIGRWCVNKRVLPLRSLVTADNRTVILNCLKRVRSERDDGISPKPAPYVGLSSEAFRPSCFGLPFAHDNARTICGGCPLKAACSETGAKVAAEVGLNLNTANPDLDRTRRLTRERVRLCRERKAHAGTPQGTIDTARAKYSSRRGSMAGGM
jgi:hypothetical protein